MHRFLTSLLASIALTSPLVRAEELLSKQTLSNWEFITATPADINTVCTAGDDGVLAIVGKPVGYLVTKADHENYQLHFEWRWPANAAKNCNGGVLLNISSGPANITPWPVCFQAQLKMDHAGDLLPMAGATFAEKLTTAPDAKTPQLDHVAASNEKPLGEWNTGDIICQGDSIEISINGVKQNHVTKCVPATGKIGFQLEGAPFELRNVRVSPVK
ncbi:MAG: DUF1080 domain-containing protein [Luteolibacter sp.]